MIRRRDYLRLTTQKLALRKRRAAFAIISVALGVTVVASASLLQGQLAGRMPDILAEAMVGLDTDAQRSIQFVRSTPGVTTALVGMRQRAHAEENLAVAQCPPASHDDYLRLFTAREG